MSTRPLPVTRIERIPICALQPAASLLPSKVNMSSSGRDGTARVTILPVVSAGIDLSVSPAGG